MKLGKMVAQIGELRPHGYSEDIITSWINEVEFRAIDEVFNRAEGVDIEYEPYDYTNDSDKELLIPDQFSGCYQFYCFANIARNNAEYDRYNNEAASYEAEWSNFAGYYRRTHYPKSGTKHICKGIDPLEP